MGDNDISDDEKALFRWAMRSTKPISPSKTKIGPSEKPTASVTRTQKLLEPVCSEQSIYLSSEYTHPVTASDILSYRHPGLPLKRFKQLQRGQIGWQARLDLHGKTVDSASDALKSFMQTQYETGHRCVLIIHGKGGHLNHISLIKSFVNHWLKQFDWVLGFHSAQPQNGGTGAVYVLLKKNRMLEQD